jgi:hypothetical protein
MTGVMKRLSNLGFTLELAEDAKDFIADKGYDSQFGARPLKRVIQKEIINLLSKNYLNIDLQLKKIILEMHSYYKFLSKELFSIFFSNFLLVNKNNFNKSKCIKENLIISFIRKFNLTQRYSNNNFNNNEKLKIYKKLFFTKTKFPRKACPFYH